LGGLSFAFNGLFWWAVCQDHGLKTANTRSMSFLTGCLIEKSLAVDNIFVFLMIYTYFAGTGLSLRLLSAG
jgi:tellurite resistance protein TerC